MLIRKDRICGRFHCCYWSWNAVVQSICDGFHDSCQEKSGWQASAFQCGPCLGLDRPDVKLRLYDHRRRWRHTYGLELYSFGEGGVQELWNRAEASFQFERWYCLEGTVERQMVGTEQQYRRSFRWCRPYFSDSVTVISQLRQSKWRAKRWPLLRRKSGPESFALW